MHFQSKLHYNSILTGSVDSYCLVCDNYLRTEDEAFMHTEKPIHKKNMGAATRVEKFTDDKIIKVKKGYYCPFCNILLTTTPKVMIHVGETNHRDNKGAQMLSRLGNNVIAFEEVAITLESWNGLIEDTCVICNTEFDENDLHRTDQNHILRLVQSKCEFGDKYVYRKVDEESFFCLICVSVFSINEKLNHHENNSHKNFYEAGIRLKNKIPTEIKFTTQIAPQKPECTNTSNGYSIKPATNKHTENVETKKTEAKIDKVNGKTKPEAKSIFSPEDIAPRLDGKVRMTISKQNETVTLFNNTVFAGNLTEINKNKTECVNGAAAHEKSEKEAHAKTETEKQSDVLDRVDEFQKAGINIDFTREQARCMRCVVYLPLDSSAIQDHIEKQHNIKPNPELNKQGKKLDTNEVKSDMKKIDNAFEPKTEIKKVENGVELKPATKKQSKKLDNIDVKTDKKADNSIEPKEDSKKPIEISDNCKKVKIDTKNFENGVEPKTNTKKTKDEMELKPVAKKTNTRLEPKEDTKKTDIRMEPKPVTKNTDIKTELKPDTKKTDNKMELEPNAKKTGNGMEIKPASKKTDNKMELEPNAKKTENGMEIKPASKKTDNKMEPTPDKKTTNNKLEPKPHSKKQKKSSNNLKLDTKKVLDTFAKENNMVVMPNEAYCSLCKVGMALNLSAMSTHANLGIHKDKMLILNGVWGNKVPTSAYIKTIIRLDSNLGSNIVLNNKYVLRLHSFHCIKRDVEGYRCMLCDTDFTKAGEQLTQHMNGSDHKNKVAACTIVSSLPEEFIREITLDVYHCGYCNEICNDLTEMQDHLSHSKHMYARRHAQWNLERCHSAIRNATLMQISTIHAINYA